MKKFLTFILAFSIACVIGLYVVAALNNASGLAPFLITSGSLTIITVLAISFVVTAFILGLISGDYSWVDREWSTVPVLYAWIYTAKSGFDKLCLIAAILISLWGLRLSYNFARKGGYTSTEDYRWKILKKRINNTFLWQCFHLFFISGYQNFLFVLFTAPLYVLQQNTGLGLNPSYLIVSFSFIGFLFLESKADEEQWRFQEQKRSFPNNTHPAYNDDIQRGFYTGGLFKYSRHPAYFGEIMIWWCVYFLAMSTEGTIFHLSGLGALLLTILFIGSTSFTESISIEKYPEYSEYQRKTSAIVPMIPGKTVEEKSGETIL